MPRILPKHGSIKSLLEYNTYSNYFGREELVDLWVKRSGAGDLSYNSSLIETNKSGRGRFEIFGTGVWELDILLPINVDIGLGGFISFGADTSGTTVSCGYSSYGASGAELGAGNFITNSLGVTAISSYEYHDAYVIDEGVAVDNFVGGTRFVKPRIEITSNPVKFYFNGFYLYPLNAAKIALWS